MDFLRQECTQVSDLLISAILSFHRSKFGIDFLPGEDFQNLVGFCSDIKAHESGRINARSDKIGIDEMDLDEAISVNSVYKSQDYFNEIMIKRETKVLQMVKDERRI